MLQITWTHKRHISEQSRNYLRNFSCNFVYSSSVSHMTLQFGFNWKSIFRNAFATDNFTKNPSYKDTITINIPFQLSVLAVYASW
jgi:hypothetical protein